MKIRVLLVTALSLILCHAVEAQTCSVTADVQKLICTLPQLFGPAGLTLPNPRHSAHFTDRAGNGTAKFFQPINTAIGEELSTLPLASPGSGISFSIDKATGVLTTTEGSLGPILSERGETIGRNRFNVGAAYQYFGFGSVDGLDLHHLNRNLSHAQFLVNGVRPDYENDYLRTQDRVDLHVNQVVIFGTAGITDRFDVTLALPIASVHMKVTSNATIVRTVPCELNGSCADASAVCGEYHYFSGDASNCPEVFNSTAKTFTNGQDASGVGDLVLRVKGQVIRNERFHLGAGVDLRFPTGDEKNFLGTGTFGATPFIAASYRAHLFSPHVRFGYLFNGDSALVGDPTTTTGTKGHLPSEFQYTAGADIRASSRITVAADLLGQRVIDSNRLKPSTYQDVLGGLSPDISSYTGSYDSDAIAVGVKVRTIRNLIVAGNITTRVNDGGLKAQVVPLVGVSYVF